MATTPVVTIRLESELRERLDRLAKAQRTCPIAGLRSAG
jgi:predicted transcriptional regulator